MKKITDILILQHHVEW